MKREREKKITRLHLILFGLVLIIGMTTFFAIRHQITADANKYIEYEEEIVEASKYYYEMHNLELEEGYTKRVNITKLFDEGILFNEDIIKKCKGYSLIQNEGSFEDEAETITHEAFITCGKKYTTKGYEKY